MRKHSLPEMKEGGVNVTPLIDVVMCLIIFFMLVAKIGVKTGSIKLDLPQTIEGKKFEELGDSIILNVTDPNIIRGADGVTPEKDENGNIKKLSTRIDQPRVVARFNEMDPDPVDIQLRREVGGVMTTPLVDDMKKAVADRKAKGKFDKFSVTIRAEKDLEYSMLEQVLAACANAGVKNLNYGTVGKVENAAAPAE